MNLEDVRKSYKFYAPIYDLVFGRIVEEGRRRAVEAVCRAPGDRILEIGVGTGRSLRYYKPDVEVTGIDVSPEMLERARKRYLSDRYPHVKALLKMDAQELEFPDNSFDGAVAMYVASVVPDPEAMVREMHRVCKPGAPFVILNHFASDRGVFRQVERRFAPLSRRLGFRPDFCLNQFVATVGRAPAKVSRVNLGGYWKLLEFRVPNEKNGSNGSNGHA
ncbi:MAG: methyltransferase domain-containing protein [Opitutales bacterium]|nr:methyltransferase domain-containing protein [Opitutales bacterium]